MARPLARLLLALLLAPAVLAAADADPDVWTAERGLPAVQTFSPQRLQSPQLFSIAMAGQRLFVGTLGGLAVYDGAHWQITPSPRALYAVQASAGGRVVAGGPDMLSEVRAGADDTRVLVSVLDRLPADDRAIGDVHSIHAVGETFLIVTDRRLLRLHGDTLQVLQRWPSDPQRRGFISRQRLYVVAGTGLSAFTAGGADAADDVTARATATGADVTFVADLDADRQLVGFEDEGVFERRGAAWRRVAPEAGDVLTHGVTAAQRLSNGAVAVASSVAGVVLLTPDLAFDRVLGRAEGLPTSRIAALAEDLEGGLWVSGEAQLARVDLASPLTLIDERMGLEGTVSATVRHDGRLHVLTSSGLFVVQPSPGGRMGATRVSAVRGRAWDALDRGDHLLVASSAGVFEQRRDVTHLVPGTASLSAYTVAARSDVADAVLVGTRAGLAELVRVDGAWRFARHVPGAPRYVRSIVSRPGGIVYVGTVFDGVVRLDLNTGGAAPQPVGPGEVRIQDVGGVIYALRSEPAALLVVDEARGVFAPAPGPARTVDAHAVTFAFDASGALWTTGHGVEMFAPGAAAPHGILDRSISVQGLDTEPDGTVWLGSSSGLWRFGGDTARARAAAVPSLERVFVNGRRVSPTAAATLPFGVERLRFEFSPNTFASDALTEFRLEPLDSGWSDARRGPVAEYTSLPEGHYTLHVRAATAAAPGTERAWHFTVQPPWHRRSDVRALELAGALGLVVTGVQLRTTRLRRRAAHLEAAVAGKTAELQQANARLAEIARRDEVTGLHNRRHFEESLALEWARAHRTRSGLALVMVDIDHFKALNDTYGHVEGDRVLEAVARVIGTSARRQGDVVARYGGEEFVVLLPNGSFEGAQVLGESIRAAVEKLTLPSPRGRGVVTVSVGIAAVEAPAGLEPTIVAVADAALYRAKSDGRNRVAA